MTGLGVTLPAYKTRDQYRCCSIVACTMYVDNRIMCIVVTEGTVCVYFGDVSFTKNLTLSSNKLNLPGNLLIWCQS